VSDRLTGRTGRWTGVVAVALLGVGLGLALRRPLLVLLAVVGVAYAVYPAVTADPEPVLELNRTLGDPSAAPGDDVEVEVSLTNVGESTLFDLRVVDGVPETLSVIDGSPRHGAVLRPGASATWRYTVRAERGKHPFQPATVVARDPSGDREVELTVAAETELDCMARAAGAPLRQQTLRQVGRVLSDRAGAGVEFHRTREYRPGDPMSRIDWNRFAKAGEFTTVEFRRERIASVVVVVDARAAAYRMGADGPHAVALGVSAARQFVETLVADRNRVGLACFGRSLAWHEPDVGRDHADALQRTLTTSRAVAATPPGDEPDHGTQVDGLRKRLSPETQLLVLSPLCDDAIVATLKTLDAQGYGVTVVSPAVTETDTPGRRLVALERRHRLASLRRSDVPVVEWEPADALAAAVSTGRGVLPS